MPNVSTQFMDDLGPLAALWAGQNQGMDENTKLVNQQNTLEQIANSQQTRDIQKQKLPFELSALEHTKAMQPHLLGEQETKTAAAKQKLNKDQFDAFFGQFKEVLPTLPGGPQDAATLAEIAKRNGMDPNDSRIGKMIAVGSSGNRQAIDDMMKRIALMSEKSIQERAKVEHDAKIKADPRNVSADVKYRTDAEAAWRAEDRKNRLAMAELKSKQGDAAKKNKNYAQAYTDYRAAAEAAYQAGDSKAGERLNQLATEMLEADMASRGAGRNTPPAGAITVENGELATRQPQPTPKPSAPGAAGPKPQLSPQDTQALDWANANPADPRALAIKKRLGIQ